MSLSSSAGRFALNLVGVVSVVGSLSSSVVVAAESSSEERERARTLVSAGDRLFRSKAYAAALERYSVAYELMPVPTVGIEVVKARAALGQLVEANAIALEVSQLPEQAPEPAVFGEARSRAAEFSQSLSERIPSILVQVTPGEAVPEIQVDGQPVSLAIQRQAHSLNPGPHRLQVSAPGQRSVERAFQLAEGEQLTLQVLLVPIEQRGEPVVLAELSSPSPADSSAKAAQRRGAVALAVAGTAATAGGVAGVLAFREKDAASRWCSSTCLPRAERHIQASKTFGHIADVSFGVAVLASTYGLWELLFNTSDEPQRGGLPASSAPATVTWSPMVAGVPGISLLGAF
jgi:hypothetical protein